MRNGDEKWPIVWNAMNNAPASPPPAVQQVLKDNLILAGNVLLWGLTDRSTSTHGTGSADTLYFVALKSPDPQLLQQLFGTDWGFDRDDDGQWKAQDL